MGVRRSKHMVPLAVAGLIALCGAATAGPIGATPANAGLPPFNIIDNGGPVLTGAVETFAIYYGDFTSTNANMPVTAQSVADSFLGDINGTTYLNIDSTFTGAPNGTASTDVTFNGAYDAPTTFGTTFLSDANILQIVQDAESTQALPTLSNAIYFVFTAPGIGEQEDSSACGWHQGDTATSTIYAWVGPSLPCDNLGGVSGNAVGDEFTETASHELFESLTDPFPNTGYSDDPSGPNQGIAGEVGDVCTNSNFAGNLNGQTFDLQSIWTLVAGQPNGGVCAQGFTADTSPVPEPASGAVILSGLTALAWLRSRRRNKPDSRDS